MKKILKRVGIAVGGLLMVVVVAGVILNLVGASRVNRHYDPEVEAIDVTDDVAAVDRGRHLAQAITLCHGCHGDDLQGDVLIDDPLIATIYASNLTSGQGGIGATYSDVDFVRAIRHGVNREGRGMFIMHSDAYQKLGAEDLAALISYVKSVPPVDNHPPQVATRPLGRILVALGLFDSESMPLIPAQVIDHSAPLPHVPDSGVTAEYGRYLVSIGLCEVCHGRELQGGPPIDADAPPAPNIAVYGAPDVWSVEQFIATIRTGVTPTGRALNPEFMPWEVYRNMTDDELTAIRQYLGTLVSGDK